MFIRVYLFYISYISLNFTFATLPCEYYSICIASCIAMSFLKPLGYIVNAFQPVSYFMRLLHATNLKIDRTGVELFC